MSSTVRLIAWIEPGQEELIRDAVKCGGFELAAVGSYDTAAGVRLSESLETNRVATLREAVLQDDAGLLWLAAGRRIEPDERRLIREAGLLTITSEPMPGSVAEVLSDSREAVTARFVPLMRQSPGYRAAREVFEQFGQRQCVNIFLGSAPGQGSLFARLFDAMDLAQTLCGSIEMLDAALCGEMSGVPETLGGLHGHLTLNMRFSDNRCACAAVSDQAGGWFRAITLLGEGGCVRIEDDGFNWTAPDGHTIDSHREPQLLSPGELVAMQVRRLLDHLDATDPPPDEAGILTLCEAARLSCRTGQGEVPRKMLEMLRRP